MQCFETYGGFSLPCNVIMAEVRAGGGQYTASSIENMYRQVCWYNRMFFNSMLDVAYKLKY